MKYIEKISKLRGNTLNVFIHLCGLATKAGSNAFWFRNREIANALGISINSVREALSQLVEMDLIDRCKKNNATYVIILMVQNNEPAKKAKGGIKITDTQWSDIMRLINANLPVKVSSMDDNIKEAVIEWVAENSLAKLMNLLEISGRSEYIRKSANMDIFMCLYFSDGILHGKYTGFSKKRGARNVNRGNEVLDNLGF